MMRPGVRLIALTASLGLLAGAGCAGYRIAGRSSASTFLPEHVRTIGIPPFANETDRPQLAQRVSEALINEFVRRGRWQATPDAQGADALLEGTIESLRTEPITFSRAGQSERVEVTVAARIRLVQTTPEQVLWAQNHYVFRAQYDLPQAPTEVFDTEIGALEAIAGDFARSVVTSILEGF